MPSVDINPVSAHDGYVYTTVTDCIGDPVDPPYYTELNNTPFVRCSLADGATVGARRGFYFFNTSVVPAGANIDKVELSIYYVAALSSGTFETYIWSQTQQKSFYGGAEALYFGLDDAAVYTNDFFNGTPSLIDLGSNAAEDLAEHPTWFGVGILIDEANATTGAANTYISIDADTSEIGPTAKPFLRVTYTEVNRNTNFLVMF